MDSDLTCLEKFRVLSRKVGRAVKLAESAQRITSNLTIRYQKFDNLISNEKSIARRN